MAKKKNISIELKWSYPREFESSKNTDIFYNGIGIYCISRKFGRKETILYIGKTDVSFKSRLEKHEQDWLYNYRGKKIVRFGTIIKPENPNFSVINDIESALIYEIQPIHNISKKSSYSYYDVFRIANIGYPGLLPRVIDMGLH